LYIRHKKTMSLFEKVNDDIKTAMKAREKDKLEALRAVKSAFLLAKTESSNKDLSEDQELKIVQKLVKQRRESAEVYKSQNRLDLHDKEAFEADVISGYLPEQLSESELEQELTKIIEQVGASGPQDMGKVMGSATKQLGGKADGKAIAAKVKELLAAKS
jgi:uncharacterized protein